MFNHNLKLWLYLIRFQANRWPHGSLKIVVKWPNEIKPQFSRHLTTVLQNDATYDLTTKLHNQMSKLTKFKGNLCPNFKGTSCQKKVG